MAGLNGKLTGSLVSMLKSTAGGVDVRVNAILHADPSIQVGGLKAIVSLNASVDLVEKAGLALYPSMLVYCDKTTNSLKEKFRRFSGKAHMVLEVRHSQDSLDNIEANTQVYVDAACAFLDDSRGDWGNGAFYTGGYEIVYDPVTRGGQNFLQRVRIGFDLEVSN